MSVGIVTWPINDVGGINSWCKNFVTALNRLGVPNRTYHATPQTRFECYEDRELVKSRHAILKGAHLSYRPEALRKSLEELNRHRLIVMLHPSPHPTRKNESSPHARDWMHLYRDTKPPKLVIFHDANWRKTNPWFAEVAPNVDAVVAAQKLFLTSVEDYPSDCPKRWDYFPLDLDLAAKSRTPADRREGVVVCTQWLKWKNHDALVPMLPYVIPPVRLYGNGQEYYTLRDTGQLQEGIRRDHTTGTDHNPDVPHEFFGFVPYDEVMRRMGGAVTSLDLSTKGYTNMTHWEPLTVGTVSMIERRVVEHPDNQIPPDCCWPYDLPDVAGAINRLCSPGMTAGRAALVRRADEFISASDCVTVTRKILTWLNMNRVVRVL